MNDFELIELVIDGNASAFEEIVFRYKSDVARTVISMLGNTIEADDVGQETFIRLYQSLARFRKDSSLKTYITRIAINLSINELRKRKRKFQIFQSDVSDNQMKISDDVAAQKDKKELIDLAMSKIDIKHQVIINLRMIQGYSTKEAAKILKIPGGTVLSRLSRAQEKLKVEIIKLEGDYGTIR